MRKEKLINAIRETIIDLETGRKKYNWCSNDSCNCGLLAENLGASRDEKYQKPYFLEGHAPYGGNAMYCKKTGASMPTVIKRMVDAGMSFQDIQDLEYLGNAEIVNEAGIGKLITDDEGGFLLIEQNRYKEKKYVLAYLQAWLRILEREQPAPEYKLVVTCSEKVKALATEKVCLS